MKRTIIQLIGFLEWVLGTVSLTIIGTVLSLNDLSGSGQITVMVILYIFLIATLIKQFTANGWFTKTRRSQ